MGVGFLEEANTRDAIKGKVRRADDPAKLRNDSAKRRSRGLRNKCPDKLPLRTRRGFHRQPRLSLSFRAHERFGPLNDGHSPGRVRRLEHGWLEMHLPERPHHREDPCAADSAGIQNNLSRRARLTKRRAPLRAWRCQRHRALPRGRPCHSLCPVQGSCPPSIRSNC